MSGAVVPGAVFVSAVGPMAVRLAGVVLAAALFAVVRPAPVWPAAASPGDESAEGESPGGDPLHGTVPSGGDWWVAAPGAAASDTLWYRERLEATTVIETSEGPDEIRGGHDARIGVMKAPEEEGADGGIGDAVDPLYQWWDQILPPPPSDLIVGSVWEERLIRRGSWEGEDVQVVKRARFEVVADTVVEDTAEAGGAGPESGEGFVVRMRAEVTVEAQGPAGPDPRMSVSASLRGRETGRFVIRPDGAVLGGRREGTLAGEVAYQSMRAPVAFPIRRSYQSVLTRETSGIRRSSIGGGSR